MKRSVFVILILLLSGCAGYFFYWRSDRRQVKILVEKMVELAAKEYSKLPHEGILKFAGSDKVFADPVEIYSETPHFTRTLNKEECRNMLAFLHRQVQFLTVKTDDLQLKISGEMAYFVFDAELSAGFRNGSKTREILLVRGRAVKTSAGWRIAAVTAEPVLKR